MTALHTLTELNTPEVDQFLSQGWLLVRGLIALDIVAELVPRIQEAIVDDGNPAGFFLLKAFPRGGASERIYTPRYQRVITDLCGPGSCIGMDGLGYLPIRFPRPSLSSSSSSSSSPQPWAPIELHVDGIHFHHHLDSREQALIAVEIWTDIDPGGGGTAIIPGSHLRVANILAAHEPAGLECHELGRLAREACPDLAPIEARGQAGDVLFMHPHLLHGSSTNTTNRTRIAGNRCVWLDRPLPYMAPDAPGWTPVGLAIHQGLGAC